VILGAGNNLRLDAYAIDYAMVAIYFGFVLLIGYAAKRRVSTSMDFFLSGRSLPAWITGLAFISANLGAIEIIGMSANGAQYGMPAMHYFWIGAVPAMLFLGVVMMPFYYGSKVRTVPEFMRRRFGAGAHLVNAVSFALAQVLIAGVNLYLLGSIVNALLGWPLWVAIIAAAAIVLTYITLGGLSAAIYTEVLQFFVIVAALLPLTLIGLYKVGGWGGLMSKITGRPEPPGRPRPGQRLSCPGSPIRCCLWWASCSALASCSVSGIGRRTSLRSSGRWHRIPSRPRGQHPSSVPFPRCSCRSSWWSQG